MNTPKPATTPPPAPPPAAPPVAPDDDATSVAGEEDPGAALDIDADPQPAPARSP